jgi:hypothetical protein
MLFSPRQQAFYRVFSQIQVVVEVLTVYFLAIDGYALKIRMQVRRSKSAYSKTSTTQNRRYQQ